MKFITFGLFCTQMEPRKLPLATGQSFHVVFLEKQVCTMQIPGVCFRAVNFLLAERASLTEGCVSSGFIFVCWLVFPACLVF